MMERAPPPPQHLPFGEIYRSVFEGTPAASGLYENNGGEQWRITMEENNGGEQWRRIMEENNGRRRGQLEGQYTTMSRHHSPRSH
jgi:hypothetical protein